MSRIFMMLLLAVATGVCGCAVNNRKQMVAAGRTPLDAESLYQLVADRSLHLSAVDFDGKVFFGKNGKLSAANIAGEKDKGKWDITTDNMLCLDFNTWYYSDLKCYSVFAEPDGGNYIFFTGNGARYYTASPLAETPSSLSQETPGDRSSYLQQKMSSGDDDTSTTEADPLTASEQETMPQPDTEEMKHILVTTARDCPNCDLRGADLSRADLVGANLTGANLAGANLSRANLRRANLAGANLEKANLKTANLPGADLRKCDLRNADLTGANLIKADLTGAVTEGTLLQGVHLEGTTGLK